MQTKKLHIIETKTFLARLHQLLHKGQDAESLRETIKSMIVQNPELGKVIPRTGGVRKFRCAASGRGKRGGYRVIYYFYDKSHPVLLMSIYAKNVTENLSVKEEKEFCALVAQWKSVFKGK